MRVLLFTGAEGAGRTSLAAACALACRRAGLTVSALALDGEPDLADALSGVPDIAVRRFDPLGAMASAGPEITSLAGLFSDAGDPGWQAGELVTLAGLTAALGLLEIGGAVPTGSDRVLVVDAPPAVVLTEWLALPEALSWYGARLLGLDQRIVRARSGRLVSAQRAGLAAFDALGARLTEVHRTLADPATTAVRVVCGRGARSAGRARRAVTTFAALGVPTASIVVGADDAVSAASGAFEPVPVLAVPWIAGPAHVVPEALADAMGTSLAQPGEAAPATLGPLPDGDGYRVEFALPFARREELSLARSGEHLLLTVAGRRRPFRLPSALRRCAVVGSALTDGRLVVRFQPDPSEWIR